ncbi:hypothetical protein K9M78_04645 [Candidatus Bipolaricaulota bacterium]|nr:hypothetical protein [Candidatus Bipolaricaulota bacterium]
MRRLIIWVSVLLFVLTVSLSLPNNVEADTQGKVEATLTFVVNRQISIDDASVIEGETAVFTVSLSGEADETVTVDYATVDGTAIAGEDYSTISGIVTFQPGETTSTISVPTLEDSDPEPDKTFFVNLSNPQGPAKIDDGQGVGIIADDDSNPTSIIIGNDTQYEGNPMEFSVNLSNPVQETVTLQYYTRDDTAVSGEDYEGILETSPLTLTFQPGETEKVITIDTLEDTNFESTETFRVILENASGPAVILNGEGTGNILNDDPPAGGGGGGEEESEQAGAAGEVEGTEESCTPICPPGIPLLNAVKTDELSVDKNGNGLANSGDVIQYEVVIDSVEGSAPEKVRYLEPISPHLKIIKDSLAVSAGEAKLTKVGKTKLITGDFQGENNIKFPLGLKYKAKVSEALPDNIGHIGGQGIVYSSNYPTSVTNDPDTPFIDDSTWTQTPKGRNFNVARINSSQISLKLEKSVLSKESAGKPSEENAKCENCEQNAKSERSEIRFAEKGTAIKFGISIENTSDETIVSPRLVNPVDKHLVLNLESVKLGGNPISHQFDEETGVFSVNLPSIAPGGSLFISYWASFRKEEIPDDLGYIGNRAYLVRNNGPIVLSDDPDTELLGDRTVVLLQSECKQDVYVDRWERWIKRINELEPGIFPLVFSSRNTRESGNGGNKEKEIDDGLNWVMIGERSKDQLSSESIGEDFSSRFESGTIKPRYRFLGTAKFDLEPNFGQLFIGRKANSSLGGKGGSEGEANTEASIYAQGFEGKTIFKQIQGKGELTPLTLPGQSEGAQWCGKGYIPFVSELDSGQGMDLEKFSDDFFSLISIEGNKSDF